MLLWPARRRKLPRDAVDGGRNESEGADEGDRLDKLAAVLLTLSPAERERLAAMLTAHQGRGKSRQTPLKGKRYLEENDSLSGV